MKKFSRFKTVEEIRQQCKAAGITCNTSLFDWGQSEYIVIRSRDEHGESVMLYCEANGTFFGKASDGKEFSSRDRLDGAPWFDKLLDFFYVPQEEEATQ